MSIFISSPISLNWSNSLNSPIFMDLNYDFRKSSEMLSSLLFSSFIAELIFRFFFIFSYIYTDFAVMGAIGVNIWFYIVIGLFNFGTSTGPAGYIVVLKGFLLTVIGPTDYSIKDVGVWAATSWIILLGVSFKFSEETVIWVFALSVLYLSIYGYVLGYGVTVISISLLASGVIGGFSP